MDLQYMFHRHLYRIRKVEDIKHAPMLSANINGTEVETARLYFTMKDFCEIVKYCENNKYDMVVCMDSKSARKNESDEYKSNRKSLDDVDLKAIDAIESTIRNAGIAAVKYDGYEADDLIAEVVSKYKTEYEAVEIFTPDSDLCYLVCENVEVLRYKSVNSKYGKNGRHAEFMEAHDRINIYNYEEMLSKEFKVSLPYNTIQLFKSTVGDSSDKIAGIRGFGPAAFNGYMAMLKNCGVNFNTMGTADETERILKKSVPLLGESGVEQALSSLELVRSRTNEEIVKLVENLEINNISLKDIKAELGKYAIVSI